jgi:CDP-6-deoxy-D-xylo-4-hexulose-3-dehydrase
MDTAKQAILDAISDYVKTKKSNPKWEAGKDWVQYSGPYYDDKEFVNCVDSLLNEWFILGEKGREFEKKFAPHLGKSDGIGS